MRPDSTSWNGTWPTSGGGSEGGEGEGELLGTLQVQQLCYRLHHTRVADFSIVIVPVSTYKLLERCVQAWECVEGGGDMVDGKLGLKEF